MTWRMPAEWERHERTWLAFPTSGYTLGETEREHEAARTTWASVANQASEFEKVTVVVNPGDEAIAKKYLSSQIELMPIAIDDAWIRDSGPTFVTDSGKLGAVNWIFNGWGAQGWANFGKDAKLVLHMMPDLVRHDIGGGEISPGPQTVRKRGEECGVEIDLAIHGAVERPCRLRGPTARRVGRPLEQHQCRRGVGRAKLLVEHLRPDLFGIGEGDRHELSHRLILGREGAAFGLGLTLGGRTRPAL